MEAPAYFTSTLDREFRGRLRIRWSPLREEWHIEQKMERGIFEIPINPYNDKWVRVRDGYSHVMAIKPRDWMACPICNSRLSVPLFHTGEAKCERCAKKGIDARWRAAFYPLNDRLIRYLKQIDPERANVAEEQTTAADLANAKREQTKERDTSNHIEAVAKDEFRNLAGIPSVGYTGKEFIEGVATS